MSNKIKQSTILAGRGLVQPTLTQVVDSFRLTNLDLENSDPSGGPINDPRSRFVHKFTPTNTYVDSMRAPSKHTLANIKKII